MVTSAAWGAVGFAGLSAQPARGGLMVELLAKPGAGYTVSPDGKFVQPSAFGVTVTMGVYARIFGTDSVQTVGDFDGQADAPDTRNNDALDILVGSFSSGFGGVLGNMNPTPGPVSYKTSVTPFDSGGTLNGVAQDFDSDGDLDIGGLGNEPAPMWTIRSGALTYATRLNGTTNGWTNASLTDGSPTGFGVNSEDMLIDATSAVLRIGTLRFVPTGGAGTASINYIPRPPMPLTSGGLWFEDGLTTGRNPENSPFTVGAPVVVSIPEPAGLLGLAAIGLLTRRRRD
jgi:hypothetical protein